MVDCGFHLHSSDFVGWNAHSQHTLCIGLPTEDYFRVFQNVTIHHVRWIANSLNGVLVQ